jgi:hypothetical protein
VERIVVDERPLHGLQRIVRRRGLRMEEATDQVVPAIVAFLK